jgi:uncharacterized membrane protein YbhN (UPF0104 family)
LGLSTILLSKSGTVLTLSGISFAIAVMLILLLFLASKYDIFISRKLGNRIPAISGFLATMKEGIGKMFDNPSAMILSLVISLPVWFFEISGTYLAARAIEYPISFSLATVAGITAFISQTIPVTPAGIDRDRSCTCRSFYQVICDPYFRDDRGSASRICIKGIFCDQKKRG